MCLPSGEGGRFGTGHSQRGAGCRRTGAGGGSAGGRPRRCSCPFTVSASEAALTRTSAIRLPPGLGPETGGGGAGLGAAGEGGAVEELTPFRGTELPWGREGQAGSLQGVSMSPFLLQIPTLPQAKGQTWEAGREGGVLVQGPREECHLDVRGQTGGCAHGRLSPNCPQETPPPARGFGAGSPSQSGGRETVLSRCGPKGEIMGGWGWLGLRGGKASVWPGPALR